MKYQKNKPRTNILNCINNQHPLFEEIRTKTKYDVRKNKKPAFERLFAIFIT